MNTSYRFVLKKIKTIYHLEDNENQSNKYIMIYRAIKTCILKSELPNNSLLPSTRLLALELDVSRTTVNKAYELLSLEKLIMAKAGSGYRINYDNRPKTNTLFKKSINFNEAMYPKISEKGHAYTTNISLVNKVLNDNLSFRPGLPPIDAFPVNHWKKLLNAYWRHIKSSNLSYSSSTGLLELKKSIANYLNISRNIKCDFNQIVIVSGSLQSLYLIANTLVDKGDGVVLENPVFPNVHSVFKSSQAKLIPVDLDEEGIRIKSIDTSIIDPKIIHVTPSNHYPLGVKMSLKRRQELLTWASKHKSIIIENDYENEIANNRFDIPSLFSLDNEDRIIYMGTFNRLLHPSIRLGYMIVPQYLIKTVEALQEHSHRFVSPSIQVVMTQFIEKNYLYHHIKTVIAIAEERYNLFCSEFEAISKIMYIEPHPCSSFHLIAKFKNLSNISEERAVIDALNSRQITVHALSKCYLDHPQNFGLIMGYSAVRPSILKQKIKEMKGIV